MPSDDGQAGIPQGPPPGDWPVPPQGGAGEYAPEHEVLHTRSLNGLGIAAGACGLTALALCWIPFVDFLSLVLGALAIVLGVLGIRRANGFPGEGKALAITGVVCGIIGFAIAAIVLLLIYTLLAAATSASVQG